MIVSYRKAETRSGPPWYPSHHHEQQVTRVLHMRGFLNMYFYIFIISVPEQLSNHWGGAEGGGEQGRCLSQVGKETPLWPRVGHGAQTGGEGPMHGVAQSPITRRGSAQRGCQKLGVKAQAGWRVSPWRGCLAQSATDQPPG